MDVSIILVSYNTKELTRNCINSIYEKTSGLDFDVWVVDNDSEDGSAEMIKEEFPQVKLIESKENLGFGRGNNLAIEKSDAKYVFLLNTDTLLVNNAVKILFDNMEKPEYSHIGYCGGNLYDANMNYANSFGGFPCLKHLMYKTLGIRFFFNMRYHLSEQSDRTKPQDVQCVIGADLMIRKSVLDEVGAFDDRFFMYFEEVELNYRMAKNGYLGKLFPDSQIIHLEGQSTKKPNFNKEKHYIASELLFFELRYNKSVRKLVKFMYFLYYSKYILLRFFNKKYVDKLRALLAA
ncbi:MAG: glycosyltransferase family 2 protein [bacterium]